MERTNVNLAKLVSEAAQSCPRDRLLVAIAGAPGSGKSTIAAELVTLLNSKDGKDTSGRTLEQDPVTGARPAHLAVSVSTDGFHLPRSVLNDLPDRDEAYARRGAPWTFDVKTIVALVKVLRDSAEIAAPLREPIYAPTFDHAIKDPVENAVLIPAEASIIILEGNYLLLDNDHWRDVCNFVDLRIFVEIDSMEARTRVAKRHVYAGIEMDLESAERRFDRNDGINGTLIRENLIRPDKIVQSVTESAL